ncbi:MAG: N-acyl-D-glucosamine 2-epimerase [Bacteroidales bacterium]|nr:N-acyl-D-glucosamine 2-epimerase [Bacteroidales bacterium]
MTLQELKQELTAELERNILPYWTKYTIDRTNGGFYGRISNDNVVDITANKGSILNARILWTFSAAFNALKAPDLLKLASRAYEYVKDHFIDKTYGGVYWMVDHTGKPLDTRKQIYALAFTIYGLSEYYKASGNDESLNIALDIYRVIEEKAFDPGYKGYFEAYQRNWSLIEDQRLSDKDLNVEKTMNTHLHVLEAYSNLYDIWKDAGLRNKIEHLIEVFLNHIVNNETGHFNMFMETDWKVVSGKLSYGHDVEGAWLLQEATEKIGNPALLARVKETALKMTDAALLGIDPLGGLYADYIPDMGNETDREWWTMAEGVVGCLNAFEISHDPKYLDAAFGFWDFLKKYQIDRRYGEWFYRVDEHAKPILTYDKVGPWKCPYHNARMCLEVMRRVKD